MLMGKFQNSIDAKNRMIIPAKFRDELGYKCVLTTGLDGCLYIYTLEAWKIFDEKLTKLPMADPNARKFKRRFYANLAEQEIDKQGRMTIPQELRDFAGITKEIVTIGCSDKIEIWSKENWDAENGEGEMQTEEIIKGMEIYGI